MFIPCSLNDNPNLPYLVGDGKLVRSLDTFVQIRAKNHTRFMRPHLAIQLDDGYIRPIHAKHLLYLVRPVVYLPCSRGVAGGLP